MQMLFHALLFGRDTAVCEGLSGFPIRGLCVRPHRLVGGVFQRMTMPYKSTRVAVDTHNDPGNAARLHPHGILRIPPHARRGHGWSTETQRL